MSTVCVVPKFACFATIVCNCEVSQCFCLSAGGVSEDLCQSCGSSVDGEDGDASHKCDNSAAPKKTAQAFSSKICAKAFSVSTNLVVHMRTHTGERPYKCHVCSKSFARPGTLRDHLRVHTREKPYCCQLCGECFGFRANHRAHVLKAHSETL